MANLKTAVLISGRGSNLKALIDACAEEAFPADIVLVLSNVPQAGGLAFAKEAGLMSVVVDHTAFDSREEFETALHEALIDSETEQVCLAGFMRLLTESFVRRWWNRLINIHPSLLPAFRGLATHERVIEYGARFTGCTVHFVRPAMDDGPIIVQAVVPVLADDDADSLAARILVEEHEIYPMAVRAIAESRVEVIEERVIIRGAGSPRGGLINPTLHHEVGRQAR
jgi:phosphoribosylglycinamide formyltransferase-1